MLDAQSKEKGIAVGVVRSPDGKVLIMQRVRTERGSDDSKLTWVFPGGKLDGFETFDEAVVREVLLETGYKVKVVDLISERFHPQFNVNIKYFNCELVNITTKPIQVVHEVSSVKWVTPSELKDYFTTDLDEKVAKFLEIA